MMMMISTLNMMIILESNKIMNTILLNSKTGHKAIVKPSNGIYSATNTRGTFKRLRSAVRKAKKQPNVLNYKLFSY